MAQPADDHKSEVNHLWPTSLIVNQAYAMAFSCVKCNGIAKTCMNNEDGEILCGECAKQYDNTSSCKTVQKLISKLKTKCLSLMDNSEQHKAQNIETEGNTDEMEGNNLIATQIEDNKCNWTGMIQEWEQHGAECQYLTVKCSDCNTFQCKRKLLPKHTNDCPEVTINCPLSCGSDILRKNIKDHLANACTEQLLDCTNDDCKQQIKRKDFDDHVHKTCDSRIVECEFSKYGCMVKQIKANQLKQHINEYKFDHLSNKFDHISNELYQENKLLKMEFNTAKNTIATLSDTVKNQQQTIIQLTQRLQQIETEFEDEKKASRVVNITFDNFVSRYIVSEAYGKRVKTQKGGCSWISVYSSKGFNSGIKQWKIKIVSIGSDGSSFQQVGIATEIHSGNNCYGKYLYTNGGVTSGTGFQNDDIITITLDFANGKVTMLKNGNMLKEQNIDRSKTYYPAITLCGCPNQVLEVV